MCGSEEDGGRRECADVKKIIENIWNMTETTKEVPALIDKLQGLFNFEERHDLNWLQDNHLKCFFIYGKFIRERHNLEQASLLLKALRATGNTDIAESIKLTEDEMVTEKNNNNKVTGRTTTGLIIGTGQNQVAAVKRPFIFSYGVNGKNKIYTNPDSMRISRSIAHKLTTLNLNDVQVSLSVLKDALKPCNSLENLHLRDVILLTTCESTTPPLSPSSSSETTEANTESNSNSTAVHFPHLKSYKFHSDNELSKNYSWSTIFFFSILGNLPSDLLNFWKSQTEVDVKCESMTVQLNAGELSTAFISLPKKQFYDSPRFISYIPKEYIREFFKKSGKLNSCVCLLPSEFDKISFNELPNCSTLHISGLDISYNAGSAAKFYKNVNFENCTLSKIFFDEIATAMPLAKEIELKDCQLDNADGANISIIISE